MSTWYIKWWGLSLNEGAGPANFHIRWWPKSQWFIYIYWFGKRWHS